MTRWGVPAPQERIAAFTSGSYWDVSSLMSTLPDGMGPVPLSAWLSGIGPPVLHQIGVGASFGGVWWGGNSLSSGVDLLGVAHTFMPTCLLPFLHRTVQRPRTVHTLIDPLQFGDPEGHWEVHL